MGETSLYPAIARFLNGRFPDWIRPRHGPQFCRAKEVSRKAGEDGGGWSRPDLALVSAWRPLYSNHWNVDLYGFEVKTSNSGNVPAVHEALAHARFVHFPYLIWHGGGSRIGTDAGKLVVDQCEAFGVGLIAVENVDLAESYKLTLRAKRAAPSPDSVDEFIETRFDETTRESLQAWLKR